MTRTELTRAVEQLESAANQTADGDTADRLTDLAAQLETISRGESDPDHGRIARLQAALDEIQPTVADDPASEIEQARAELSTYRETLEGV